jgi:hypothetical protein
MDTILLAQIIQGEAGGMGPLGMMAVAMSLSCRVWQHHHDNERIAREWYGRAEPGPEALMLAGLVESNRLPKNDYYFCMGEGPDVRRFGWVDGDATVHANGFGLHLYKEWPKVKDESTGLPGTN